MIVKTADSDGSLTRYDTAATMPRSPDPDLGMDRGYRSHEADLSAASNPSQENPRIPPAHEDAGGTRCHPAPACKGPEAGGSHQLLQVAECRTPRGPSGVASGC
jgi:hypothetical protein